MAPSLSESHPPRRLSALLDEMPWSAGTNQGLVAGLRLVRSLAWQVHRWHEDGRIHGAITADAVTLDAQSEPLLDPPLSLPNRPRFGGQYSDPEVCPPFLVEEEVLELPETIPAAAALLRQRQLQFDPRQIDIYQLGTLLCRLLTGRSVLAYMYDPRAKGALPRVVRGLLERLLAAGPGEGFQSCSQLAEATDEAIRGLGSQASPSSPRAVVGEETPARGSGVLGKADDTPARGHSPAGAVAPTPPGPAGGGDLPFRRLGIYTIVSRIGSGGMGDVYLAHDESLDRPVALKVLPPDLARDAEFVRRFRAEATAAAKVVHPNVVPIYSIDEDAGHHFFSMHYVEGESLSARLGRQKRLATAEAVELIRQCLAGLGAAHAAGLIHRDVKPGNILIERSTGRVMLVDFGLVRRLGESARMTATGVIMGTVDYIAPEQARGKQVDGRADLYSLGVMFYQLLSGSLPFEADTPTAMIFQHAYEAPRPLGQLAPDVPETLVSIVARLMAKDPADRYQDASSVLADLDRLSSQDDQLPEAIVVGDASEIPSEEALEAAAVVPQPPPSLAGEEPPARPRGSTALRAWRALCDWVASLFPRYWPQLAQQLQSTTQQVDAAVAEYERRRKRLVRLAEEARTVVADLSQQMEENRRAAGRAAAQAESTVEESERRDALAQRDACRQHVEAMAEQLKYHKEQLEDIEAQMSRADATLARLRSQRDLLRARWKAVEARRRPPQGRPASLRKRRRLVLWAAVGACCLAAASLVMLVRRPQPRLADGKAGPVEILSQKPLPPGSVGGMPLEDLNSDDVKSAAAPNPAAPKKDEPDLAKAAAGLHYNFQPHESYVYEVRIEADLPTTKETTFGHVTYTVTSAGAEAGQMTLSVSAPLITTNQSKQRGLGFPYGPPGFPGPSLPLFPFETSFPHDFGYARAVTIDHHGALLQYGVGGELPYLLGPVEQLVIDPLPPEGEKTWTVNREIELRKRQESRLPGWLPPSRSRSSSSVTRWTSQANVQYTLTGVEGTLAVIGKKYHLVTDQKTDGKPLLEKTGEGQIRFDLEAGVPTSVNMEYSITVKEEGVTVGIPVTLTARRLSKSEVEEFRRKGEEALAAAKARAAEAAKPKPIDDAELDQVLANLASGESRKAREAVKRLAGAIVIESRRREVATALEGVLSEKMRLGSAEASKALGIWGSEENVPALAKLLDDHNYFVRQAAIAALAKFPAPEAARAVAAQLRDLSSREDAVKALQTMGAVAEDPVLPILDDSDGFVRAAACQVLAEVGTSKSLDPLKKLLAANSTGPAVEPARKAIAAIQARQKDD